MRQFGARHLAACGVLLVLALLGSGCGQGDDHVVAVVAPTAADESATTVGLDAISKQAVFSELLGAVGDGERTVLISSHGLADVERFADHLGMIRDGRLLFEGATADVIP